MDQYHDMNDNINISDVIEVIQTTDPEFVEEARCRNQHQQQHQQKTLNMLSGGGVETVKPVLAGNTSNRVGSYVEIVEQPASKALRFRYECEGRSAGSIPGVNSIPENKTFPSIKIVGYKGRAVVVVSCVTKDPPYRPHPHNLVGKEACRRGVCTLEISSENMTVTFANLGIQCVKKKDIEEALRIREEIRVDPFRTGFSHKRQPASIDLNAVRLCFQVFLEGTEPGKFTVPLTPVVSDPIYDKKAMSDLVICKLSHYSAPVAGGMEMLLLCEKVAKEDIQIRFTEERDGQIVWEGFGDFQPSHVHKQVAISFRTPTYRIQQVEHPVQVYIQLRRPSDSATSEALPFQFLPLGADGVGIHNHQMQYNFNLIKPEPMDSLYPSMAGGSSSPMYPVGSPISPSNLHTLRQIRSPRRTPSPMGPSYSMQQPQTLTPQYHSPSGHASPNLPAQLMYNQSISLSRVTPEPSQDVPGINHQGFHNPLVNAENVNNVLDLGINQCSFDINQLSGSLNPLDSDDLAVLGNAFAESFSSGLSLSDSQNKAQKVEPNAAEEGLNMTDSFTKLTNSTIQELCTLNNLYKPMQE
ncbi:embryonic polarity protein dorsal-like isoform X3 [Cotesia glomerata]|uniref:embryonic polarity protein dorsal-like isoform X3 n=1 Tax=Cotesia glomerata TaxID=32391 RepID=UPI001D0222D8|nr:embryonic polarity protein dorsal-like isoform X3 [Cotesia glomerata]